MALEFTLDDVAYLSSPQGGAALVEVETRLPTGGATVADVAAIRRRFGARAAILIETTRLRRRADVKLPGTADWLFTDDSLQQATAAPVAAHRATRLAGRAVHDVTCSIGAELAALRGTAAALVGSDLDPVRLAMARHNLSRGGVPAPPLCRADALVPVTRDTVVVADPARRSGGRRRFDPRDYIPALDRLADVYRGRDLVVKCSPGIDFDALPNLGYAGEVELVSLAGSVREACLWSPGLTEPGVTRRAVMLDRAEQITDADPADSGVAAAGRWIVDPDGAVVRAGLVRQYATRHGLWQLDPHIAYLSGDRLPAGVRGFEVLEELAYSENRLRRTLAANDCGVCEILVRGVDVDPDAVRRRLRLRGTRALSVVIMRMGTGTASRPLAFVCRAARQDTDG